MALRTPAPSRATQLAGAALASILLFVGAPAMGGTTGQAEILRWPYLQQLTPTSVVVVWRTNRATAPEVRIGESPDRLNLSFNGAQVKVRYAPDVTAGSGALRLHSAPPGTHQYEAKITGLRADTTYFYGVFDGSTLLAGEHPDYRISTPPATGAGGGGAPRALRFWVTGDTGEGSAPQRAAFNAALDYARRDGRAFDAVLHLGDMAYESGRDNEFQENFFDIYRTFLCRTVTWPTMGNHEGFTSDGATGRGPYYDAYVVPVAGEAGGLPSGTEAYYSFDLGPAHFICLDSYDLDRTPEGAMAAWLRADLGQTTQRWLIAFWHHPPYTKGTHDSDRERNLIEMRQHLMPILEDGGVDLVLAGHSHIYERSMLIDRAYATPTVADGVILDDGDGDPGGDGPYRKGSGLNSHAGTIAVVAGHGAGAGRIGTSPIMRSIRTETGSLVLDLEGDTLTGVMVDLDGIERDRFQIEKRQGWETPEPLQFPWQIEGPVAVTAQREPGAQEVTLRATPDAPDAVIYYTLDGSEPGPASPRYSGPVRVEGAAVIKVISRWRGETRQSPVTSLVLEPAPLTHQVRVPVAGAADDGAEDASGAVDLGATKLSWVPGGSGGGSGSTVGLRFRDIRVPRYARVRSAHLQFTSSGSSYGLTEIRVQAEFAADAHAFAPERSNLTRRLRTVATSPWRPPNWGVAGTRRPDQSSPDFAAVVQEVVDHPGWRSGNTLALLLSGTGSRNPFAFEGGPAAAAELRVTFDPPPANTVPPTGVPRVRITKETRGSRSFEVTFDRFRLAEDRGINYTVEVTNDLAGGVWRPVPTTAIGPARPVSGSRERVTLRLGLLLRRGDRELFVRVRESAR